jgi:hypothetical protein
VVWVAVRVADVLLDVANTYAIAICFVKPNTIWFANDVFVARGFLFQIADGGPVQLAERISNPIAAAVRNCDNVVNCDDVFRGIEELDAYQHRPKCDDSDFGYQICLSDIVADSLGNDIGKPVNL